MIDHNSVTTEHAVEELCSVCDTSDQRVTIPEIISAWKEQGQDGFICLYCVIELVRNDPDRDDSWPATDQEWDQLLAGIYRKTGVRQTHFFNPLSWQQVKAQAIGRDGRWCYLCDLPIGAREKVHLDHVIPRKRGGTNYWTNLRPTHAVCNLWKGHRSLDELDLEAWRAGREALWLTR